MEQYPRDEFDELADARRLRGSHRRRPHWLATIAPLLAAVILAPLAGWGIVEIMSQDGVANPFATQSAEQSATPEPTDEATTDSTESVEATEPESEPTDEPTEEPADEQTEPTEEPIETDPPISGVVYDASIELLDGGGAAQSAESALLTAGFTGIASGDFAGTNPAQSAIFFSSPDLYTTAQNIARILNIDYWAENAAMTGGSDIVIIVR
ncbi:hypothetical protein EJO69_09575 [Flaviflexus salsibiostraticola]|uniref:LytR family transcriptional regulator n=1 Tax=Flaviflexus salsibiostraticola TaxID=1282737 RepID=A0A3Q8WW44_9ACTO|nr:hypothetical protein [Flaviflexus salsibiostraticola]AZN30526.1 hypothetical protein EJO69_09575 [Flaviflexus salsibiostraticola]